MFGISSNNISTTRTFPFFLVKSKFNVSKNKYHLFLKYCFMITFPTPFSLKSETVVFALFLLTDFGNFPSKTVFHPQEWVSSGPALTLSEFWKVVSTSESNPWLLVSRFYMVVKFVIVFFKFSNHQKTNHIACLNWKICWNHPSLFLDFQHKMILKRVTCHTSSLNLQHHFFKKTISSFSDWLWDWKTLQIINSLCPFEALVKTEEEDLESDVDMIGNEIVDKIEKEDECQGVKLNVNFITYFMIFPKIIFSTRIN